MRMVCDSSYILDQKTRYDTKVDECINLISDIVCEEGEKVVVFSQWERMTRLVAKELRKKGIGFEYRMEECHRKKGRTWWTTSRTMPKVVFSFPPTQEAPVRIFRLQPI